MKSTILHIDDAIVAINKPPGLSLATPRTDPGAAVRRLVESLPASICTRVGLSAEMLWLLHRLDIGTSGLVVLARSREAHAVLSREWAERRIEKTYLALVWGHPRPQEGCYEWPLGPDRRDRRRMRVDLEGRPAKSCYRTLADARHVSLIELHPETGRTHQLRVHLSHAGHWIVGDDLYGGPRHRAIHNPRLREILSPPHTLLHAWRLQLPATALSVRLHLEAPLPETFTRALSELKIPPGWE